MPLKKPTHWAPLLITLLLVASCAHRQTPAIIALFNYQDFGPQSAAYELLGMQTWSWQKKTCCKRKQSPAIVVVVYRNTTLEQAQKNYPIDKKNQLDYRYISYQQASTYLNSTLTIAKKAGLESLAKQLIETKSRMQYSLAP